MSGEKTEAPTPRRRAEARNKGQVAKSTEVNSALILLASIWILSATGSRSAEAYTRLMKRTFSNIAVMDLRTDLTIETLRAGAMAVGAIVGQIIAPLILTIVAVGVVANLVQVGFLFSQEAFKPDFKRINPASGFKRFVSLRTWVELLKSILKVLIIGGVVYTTLRDNAELIASTSRMTLLAGLGNLARIGTTVAQRVAIVMLAMAAADYLYQRYEFEKGLRMSKQEIKEEMKRQENPQLKSRIRSRQRQMAMKRMMAAVPKADVVITNPTHIAVALHYEQGKAPAPQVVAKGQRVIAEKIKQKAQEHNVPLVENKPLARTLFKSVEIGQLIPNEVYQAVAEVLAFVYRLKPGRKRA